MKPWKENGAAISSEEVNFLVFRYLQESGESLLRSIYSCTLYPDFARGEVCETWAGRAK